MGLYNSYILPKLIHWACSQKDITFQRQMIIPRARGRVLEIGIGSGLNLPFYSPEHVDSLWGVEPLSTLKKITRETAIHAPFNVDLIGLSGEEIPLEKKSVDTVVVTYTLCSIPDVGKALNEMNRVLKPGGELIFCEHGKAPDAFVSRWQDRMNPIWQMVSGGCHLNRPIPDLIEKHGFKINRLDMKYISGMKPLNFNYWGSAVHG